jgi:MFS family permease
LTFGGRISDRWLKNGMLEAPLRVAFLSLLGVACTLVPAMVVQSAALTVVLLVPAMFFLALPIGCLYASVQMIFTNEVRATISAIMLLAVNLCGVSLGTLLPGLLDDRLFHDDQMLGRSIAITAGCACVAGIAAALFSFRPYRRDFAALRAGA